MAALDEREQSGETSLVESEETCVETRQERKCLTQGRRFTEPDSDSGRMGPGLGVGLCGSGSRQGGGLFNRRAGF